MRLKNSVTNPLQCKYIINNQNNNDDINNNNNNNYMITPSQIVTCFMYTLIDSLINVNVST